MTKQSEISNAVMELHLKSDQLYSMSAAINDAVENSPHDPSTYMPSLRLLSTLLFDHSKDIGSLEDALKGGVQV